MNETKKTWIGIAFILLFLIGGLYWISSGEPDTYPPYLSESPSPTGVKAFYTLLGEKGEDTARWSMAPENLPAANESQTLIMIEPFISVSQAETEQYEEWMRKGNTIWLMKNNPVDFFNIDVDYGRYSAGETNVENEDGTSYTVDVLQEHRLRPQESDKVLLSDSEGTLVFERSYGEGKLVVGMSPDWLMNGEILEHDHYEVLTSLLDFQENNRIWFDEYIHGKDGFLSTLIVYPKWLLVFTLQLALVTILFLWMQGKRFGPIFIPRKAVVRFGDERLQALAAWYKKGEFYRESLAIQESYLRILLEERFGISTNATWEEVRQSLTYRMREEDYKIWEQWTKAVEPLELRAEVDKKSYLEWSHMFEQMRKEVQES